MVGKREVVRKRAHRKLRIPFLAATEGQPDSSPKEHRKEHRNEAFAIARKIYISWLARKKICSQHPGQAASLSSNAQKQWVKNIGQSAAHSKALCFPR